MSIESSPFQAIPSMLASPVEGPLRPHTHTYDLMRQCIHCGFCLPTCPTYAVLGVEMDSPRGRIYQMQAVADGRMAISPEFVDHMYCCLGCRACETACPSGVQFGKLIEAAREQIQLDVAHLPLKDNHTLPSGCSQQSDVGAQLIAPLHPIVESTQSQEIAEEKSEPRGTASFPLHTNVPRTPALESFTQRTLRRFFFDIMLPSRTVTSLVFAGLKLYQRSGAQQVVERTGLLDAVNALPTPFQGKLKTPEELMHNVGGDLLPRPLPEITPAIGKRRYRVGFISGCIMDQVFRDINEATIRVLTANGCEVITPPQQQCCGALHVHAGEAAQGRQLARDNIDVFEPYNCDFIIINSAGCGSNLKEYWHVLEDDPAYAEKAKAFSAKVKDISEFLAMLDWKHDLGEVPRIVAYHDACHLVHGQKIRQQPRQLLSSLPGIKMVNLKESDWCCGSAGIYNITNQEMANILLQRKMDNIAATGASVIATGNPGCMMQIALGARERGMDINVVHPIQLLDEAYRAGGLYELPKRDVAITQKQQRTLLIGVGVGVLAGIVLLRGRRKQHA